MSYDRGTFEELNLSPRSLMGGGSILSMSKESPGHCVPKRVLQLLICVGLKFGGGMGRKQLWITVYFNASIEYFFNLYICQIMKYFQLLLIVHMNWVFCQPLPLDTFILFTILTLGIIIFQTIHSFFLMRKDLNVVRSLFIIPKIIFQYFTLRA